MRLAALVLVLAALAGTARAELPVTARGSATVTGGDLITAKGRALDDALRQAVDQAVAGMIPADQREALADLVKKRILRRARSYVVRYKVTAEGENDGVYSTTVDAVLADGPLGNDVRALSAPPLAAVKVDGNTPAPAPRVERPALAVLAVARSGDQVWASFGRGAASAGPVAPALERELGARGFKVVSAAGLEVPVATEGEEGLPLAPEQSKEIARKAKAGGALVAAALIKDGDRIRGTRRVGAEIELRVRLDDAGDGGKVAEGQVSAAGHGADASEAAAAAGREAATLVGRLLGKRLESHWPSDLGGSGGGSADGILVHLRGVTRGPDVDAFVRALAGGPGVKQVLLMRLARREVTLLVRGPGSARPVADVVGATALPGARVSAKAAGDEVDVEVATEPTRPPPVTPVERP